MNILMPWREIKGMSSDCFVRSRPGSKLGFHRVLYYRAVEFSCWHYEAYDPNEWHNLFSQDGKTYSAPTKESAMKIVDDALVKAGWKLLNDGDPLLSLI
jgi:hypothetical protein